MLQAGFHNFSRKSLGNFDGLGNAAALGDQAGNVRACSQETVVFETFDAHSNGNFFHVRQVFLPLHGGPLLRVIIPVPRPGIAGVWVRIVHSNNLTPGVATGLRALPPLRSCRLLTVGCKLPSRYSYPEKSSQYYRILLISCY